MNAGIIDPLNALSTLSAPIRSEMNGEHVAQEENRQSMRVNAALQLARSNRLKPADKTTRPSRGTGYETVLFLAVALFLFLCLISYDQKDPSFNVATPRAHVSNLCGLVGAHVADALVQLLGVASLLAPLGLLFAGLRPFLLPGRSLRWSEACFVAVLILVLAALAECIAAGPFLRFPGEHPGGALGLFFHTWMARLVGSAGEIVLIVTLVTLSALSLLRVHLREIAALATSAAVAVLVVAFWLRDRAQAWCLARREARLNDELEHRGNAPGNEVADPPLWNAVGEDFAGRPDRDGFDPKATGVYSWERMSWLPSEAQGPEELSAGRKVHAAAAGQGGALDSPVRSKLLGLLQRRSFGAGQQVEGPGPVPLTEHELEAAIENYLKEKQVLPARQKGSVTGAAPQRAKKDPRPITVTKRADEVISTADINRDESSCNDDYKLPPLDLLDAPPRSGRSIDEKLLKQNADILEQKLADLGIKGEVVAIHPGPVITMYELNLAAGIPLRKVLNTSDDLAMALKSGSTRVVAPIPGKDTVGIEVPNLNREIVYFREIIESAGFVNSTAPLKVALGKGIDGEPVATSLARMPHLLIAGATGTGKSVGLNCLICSWLMSCHPDDVKFLMVDPKRLELSYYQDIPHLLHPVVTEAEKVPKVLSWAIREMERRYQLLSAAGSKNIEGYNQQVASVTVKDDEARPEKLPYLVIIVDELAELMMVAAKDIEISIARLAQMARAAGIHLILATQRPSVDVITGVIKANFPARISYQVSARPDSRTILDTVGAEHLLGMGDMLFVPPGTAKLTRIHGAFVSENEIRRIADFCKAQRAPVYLQEISKHVSEEESRAAGTDLAEDEKYDEAVELVSRIGHASISLIQRHLRIGYNRAARIIEVMESQGLIGPSDGTSRPREVLARSLDLIPD